jgi:MFS transporter, DHA2 family, multidrug resistance protein
LARTQAIAEIADMVRTEAYVMSYSDCFFIMGVALIVAALALFLVPKPRHSEGAAG